jgi:hypothetical protein
MTSGHFTADFSPRSIEIAHSGLFGSDSLHHTKPVIKIIDFQSAVRENKDLDWGSFEVRPGTKTALEAAPNPCLALFWS